MTNLQMKIQFIKELEKLKVVYRQNRVLTPDRHENSAEHSWHIALMALVLEDETVFERLDMMKVVKMLLIHDIVEIDAGDVFLYDTEGRKDVEATEHEAAERLFGLLPEAQKAIYLQLWLEFEANETDEARYAKAMDALQPLLNHAMTGRDNLHGLKKSQVIAKKSYIKEISEQLWACALEAIDVCVAKGIFIDE